MVPPFGCRRRPGTCPFGAIIRTCVRKHRHTPTGPAQARRRFRVARLQRKSVFCAHWCTLGPVAMTLAFPTFTDRLPLPVPATLDPVLDATVECLGRHGLSRTSLSDIAREMGVAPSTVYRD